MTPATVADRAWIETHLRARVATSMFPLSNLAEHDWDSDAPRGMRFFCDRSTNAILGVTNDGMLMPQMAEGFGALTPLLAGRTIMGAAGAAEQVKPLIEALGLDTRPVKISEAEPQFFLSLKNLIIPEGPGHLVGARDVPRGLLETWRADYLVETIGEDPEAARATANGDVERFLQSGAYRVLMVDGEPVCLTGLNAALPDIVQIGGVWTPPAMRGQGYARRAVALHLRECQASGVRDATLFASGPAAVRAYVAIGFREIGSFSLVLFRAPEKIGE